MYAIVKIAGKQFQISQNKYIYTPTLAEKPGTAIIFDQVLLLNDGESTQIGAPVVTDAKVTGKVIAHVKADKLIVFKKKRRKGYKKSQGH